LFAEYYEIFNRPLSDEDKSLSLEELLKKY
jgi:hypothetical protein